MANTTTNITNDEKQLLVQTWEELVKLPTAYLNQVLGYCRAINDAAILSGGA